MVLHLKLKQQCWLLPYNAWVWFINNLQTSTNKNNKLKKAATIWNRFKYPEVWTQCGHSGVSRTYSDIPPESGFNATAFCRYSGERCA